MQVLIIAGGRCGERELGQRWAAQVDRIIGADGGAACALAWGLVPHLVVGDMDSLPATDRARLEALGSRFVIHPRAKDETDLELALTHAAALGASEVVILGALGGRLDHTLANLLLLTLPQLAGIRVRIVDAEEEALLVRGGEALEVQGQVGDRVSLLPLGGDALGVTARGLTWSLQGDRLRFGFSRGVSNVLAQPSARIELEEGFLLVVRGPSPDA